MAEEPPAKKAKTTGWEEHALNCSEALMKADEAKHFADMMEAPVSTLQGIGEKSSEVLEVLRIETVKDLANYEYFHIARALATLAETETEGGRLDGSVMNVDKAVDKEWETKTLKEIVDAPLSALEGLSEKASDLLKELGVTTVGQLATFKYCRWAESMVLLGSKYENTKTAKERKQEVALKKLE
eukprot:3339946-Rhodomonas_salina.6